MSQKILINKKEFSSKKEKNLNIIKKTSEEIWIKFDDKILKIPYLVKETKVYLNFLGKDIVLDQNSGVRNSQKKQGDGDMLSPMPGKIIKVLVKKGDFVKKGDSLLIMEAMKMEHVIRANEDGQVDSLFHTEGEIVEGGVPLILLAKKS